MRCGTRRVFREGGVPERVAAPGMARVGLPVGSFPPPVRSNGRASDRVGVWGRDAPNRRAVSASRELRRQRCPKGARDGQAEIDRATCPGVPVRRGAETTISTSQPSQVRYSSILVSLMPRN